MNIFLFTYFASAECASFYDNLNSMASINANNGTVYGPLTFPAAVNNNGVSFDGTNSVRYNSTIFNSEGGSITLWVKKNSDDNSGGVWQIGEIGKPNSMGIFYYGNTNVSFEIKNNNSFWANVFALGNLSKTEFIHITSIWYKKDNTYDFKLFVNGEYINGNSISGPFIHNQSFLELGKVWYSGYGYGDVTLDEARFFNYPLSDPEVYAEYIYSSNKFRNQPTNKPVSNGTVKVVGKSVLVNNKNFTVMGVGYQPIPIGKTSDQLTRDYIYTNASILNRDIPLLRAMNINTVRLWSELSNATLLDRLYNNGTNPIYTIMTYYVDFGNGSEAGIDYSNPDNITYHENRMRQFVNKFKNHSGVLAWAIGNENNMHYKKNVTDWFALANKLAKVAYEEEGASYHPTMAVNAHMLRFGDVDYKSDDASLNYTDMWGINVYPGYSFHCYFDYYDRISAKPQIVTEYGVDAYNNSGGKEYEDAQADYVVHQWREIKNKSVGGTVMEYSDEWWKSTGLLTEHNTGGYNTDTHPDIFANEEWWGIVRPVKNGSNIDVMQPRQAYWALRNEFTDFVKVKGTQFYFNNSPFYFAGANAYYLWYGDINCSNPQANQGCVAPLLNDAAALNLSVIRTWGFCNNNTAFGKYGYCFQPKLGVYNETTFAHFDRVIKEASDRNLKLIITLVNNWDDFGGMCQYVRWCGVPGAYLCDAEEGYPFPNANIHDEFYNNSCTKGLFKNYTAYFLNRTNTLTGIKYKDDPTIMAWELANEPRARSDTSGNKLNDWIGEMSAFIKSIDSNHLVATGVDGGYLNKGSDIWAWWYYGWEGQDYLRNHNWSTIDFATFHYYQSMDPALNDTKWISEHIEDGHNIIKKPVLFEEFNNRTHKEERLTTWYSLMESGGVDGSAFWMLADNNFDTQTNDDGFFVNCPEDNITCELIAGHANYMNAKRKNQTINRPPILNFISNITVNESDLADVNKSGEVIAYDLDKDNITYYYSLPLDSSGKWQTSYTSSGNYTVNITSSDSKMNYTRQVKISVLDMPIPYKVNYTGSESRFYYKGHHFLTVMNTSGTFNIRPHPGVDVNGWGSSWYMQPFISGPTVLKGSKILEIQPTDKDIKIRVNGTVSLNASLTYGKWSANLSFSYNITPKGINGTGSYNIILDGLLSVHNNDLNIYKIASNYLNDTPLLTGGIGDTGDTNYTNVTRHDGGFLWVPEEIPGHFPGEQTPNLSIDVSGQRNIVDTRAQGYNYSIAPAYKPSLKVVLRSNISSIPMTFGGFYTVGLNKNFSEDNVGVTPLVLKASLLTSFSFGVNFYSSALPGDGIDLDCDGYNYSVDCDDTNLSVNLGSIEVYDKVDNDCDGLVNEGDTFFNISLNSGWNLISVPIQLSNETLPAPLISILGKYSKIFSYVGGKWVELKNSSAINQSIGIWIKMAANDTLELSGFRIGNTSFKLYQGMNLLSYPSFNISAANETFKKVKGNLSIVFSYENNSWSSYSPAKPVNFNMLKNMTPGRGYWVDVNKNINWTFDGSHYTSS